MKTENTAPIPQMPLEWEGSVFSMMKLRITSPEKMLPVRREILIKFGVDHCF